MANDNFFEFSNSFALVDVEGVVLSANQELPIREPVNLGESQISLTRDNETQGMDFEFSDPEAQFGFDRVAANGQTISGYSLINQIAASKGSDGKCILIVRSQQPSSIQNITRVTGQPNNIESVAGSIRLLGDYSLAAGDQIVIATSSPSIYDGQTYTINTVLPPSDILAGYMVVLVDETVADSAYQGDWTLTTNPGLQVDYRGDLDFNTFDNIEIQINMTSRRINLDDLFRTRIETIVNMNSNESIDGVSLTPPTTQEMFLHSKIIQTSQNAGSNLEAPGSPPVLFTVGNDFTLQMDFANQISGAATIPNFNNNLERQYGQGVFTSLTTNTPEQLRPHYIFQNVFGDLQMNYIAQYGLLVTNTSGITIEYLGTFVRVNDVETLISTPQTFNVNSDFFVCNIDFTHQGSFNIPENAQVFIYDKWEIPVAIVLSKAHRVIPGSLHNMQLTLNGRAQNSTAQVYQPFDVFNHVLNVINNKNGVLISDFLQNVANRSYLTNGYLIRKFAEADQPLRVSFMDMFFGWAKPMFGLGFSLVDDSGTAKVFIGRYNEFYQDREIVYIPTIDDESLSITFDGDLIFNEAEIGYRDFPNSNDENKENNIDEFNTVHNLLLPIERKKDEFQQESLFIGAAAKIENQRREQFADVSQETVTDDEKVFVIQGVQGEDYTIDPFPDQSVQIVIIETNRVSLYGTYFDIQVNDNVTIVREFDGFQLLNNEAILSVEITGAYTIIDVAATLTPAASTASVWIVTVSGNRLRAARDEEFSLIEGVIDSKTVYNVGLNPRYMLLNHSLLLNSGLHFKDGADTIKVTDVQLNDQMRAQFKTNRGAYTLATLAQTVDMGADISLNDVNQFNRLFTGRRIRFTTTIGYDIVLDIKEAYLNRSHPNHYGYITVGDVDGEEIQGYLMDMKYNPLSNQVELDLRERAIVDIPLVEFSFDLVTGFVDSATACDSVGGTTTTLYSNLPSLTVGGLIYSVSGDASSTLTAQWLYDSVNDRSIQVDPTGILSINQCPNIPPNPDKFAAYEYIQILGFTKDNVANTEIEGVDYGETDTPNINIGTDGTVIRATYSATDQDIASVTGGIMRLRVEVYNGPSGADPLITALQDDASSSRQLSVTISITDAEVTNEAYVRTILSSVLS